MAEQDMTLNADKIINTAFILQDVLSDLKKDVLLKTSITCLHLHYMCQIFLFIIAGEP